MAVSCLSLLLAAIVAKAPEGKSLATGALPPYMTVGPALRRQASHESLESLAKLFNQGSVFTHQLDQVSLGSNVLTTRTIALDDYRLLNNVSGARFARLIEP